MGTMGTMGTIVQGRNYLPAKNMRKVSHKAVDREAYR
jgi:hypothetical protein